MVFWNTAGIKKKEREFWNYIEEFNIVGMSETWMEKKDWEKIKGNLPEMFNWKCQYAIKEKKKGRAKGGIVTGVKKGIEEISLENANIVNGVQERRLRIRGKI